MKQPPTSAANQCIACALTCAAALWVIAPAASAQCQYEVTAIIQGPPCGPSNTPAVVTGRGMNSQGEVAGSWQDCINGISEAFYWSPESGLVTMPRPDGIVSAIATDINDSGTIIGAHRTSQFGDWTAFVFHPKTGQYTYLPPLHFGGSYLSAVNNAGIAVGARSIGKPGQSPNPSNAVIWNTNTGEVIDLGVMHGPSSAAMDGTVSTDAAGWAGTAAFGINSRATLWSNAEGIDLGVLPGHFQSQSLRMNSDLIVIGTSRLSQPGPYNSFIWQDGKMAHFPIPDGYNIAGASDLNDVGQIVGGMRVDPDPPSDPFLLQHGEFHALADLVIDLPGNLTLGVPQRIGNDGKILLPTSNSRAVVLTPAEQPTGDLNHDCVVDTHDLLMLLEAWGPTSTASKATTALADLNGDGVVNVADLLILLANWGH